MRSICIIGIGLCTAIFAGCKFSNSAMLVDHQAHVYSGKVSFSAEKQEGSFAFPRSPYGELAGPFTLALTDEKNRPASMSRIPLKKFSGKALLSSEGKPYLDCDLTAEFFTEGTGDMQMKGCGVCTDRKGNTLDLSFE